MEVINNRNRKAVIVYVDFKKAFDSIDRRKMMAILKAYHPILETKLQNSMRKQKPKSLARRGNRILLYQKGNTLAPYLFVIVID